MMKARSFCGIFLLTLLISSAAVALEGPAVLDTNGAVLQVRQGLYGELFPERDDVDADHAVLALDILGADGSLERLLVPETDSASPEVPASLVFDRGGRIAYLLWEGQLNVIHPVLYLVGFDGEAWGRVIEITGNPFARKGHPQLVVTRDTERSATETGTKTVDITTLHVAWWEESSTGNRRRYAPLVLADGMHPDHSPSWYLSDFLSPEPAAAEQRSDAMRLGRGRNERTVVVGFFTEGGDRVATVEIESLPNDLELLGNLARAQIINSGLLAENPIELSTEMRRTIIREGTAFHIAGRRFIADETRNAIREAPTSLQLPDLGNLARAQIINSGARLYATGLQGPETFQILEVDRPDDNDRHQLLRVTTLSERPAPRIGENAVMFLSKSGADVLLAWQDGDESLRYVESEENGWSDEMVLPLGPSVTPLEGFQVLGARIQDR